MYKKFFKTQMFNIISGKENKTKRAREGRGTFTYIKWGRENYKCGEKICLDGAGSWEKRRRLEPPVMSRCMWDGNKDIYNSI